MLPYIMLLQLRLHFLDFLHLLPYPDLYVVCVQEC